MTNIISISDQHVSLRVFMVVDMISVFLPYVLRHQCNQMSAIFSVYSFIALHLDLIITIFQDSKLHTLLLVIKYPDWKLFSIWIQELETVIVVSFSTSSVNVASKCNFTLRFSTDAPGTPSFRVGFNRIKGVSLSCIAEC